MADGGNVVPNITKAEHIGPNDTGDNIEAKRVANYIWNGSSWERQTASSSGGAVGLMPFEFDDLEFSNPDANGNYQTGTVRLASTDIATLTLTYDASNNLTRITRVDI